MLKAIALFAFNVLIVSSTTSAASASPLTNNSSLSGKILWSTCPPGSPLGLDCGTIDVPLAYKQSGSLEPDTNQTVTLGLVRHRTNSTMNKLGSLFFNPGGPGVSATRTVISLVASDTFGLSQALKEAYDIIGLDPRGVGSSTPVQCDPEIYNERVTTMVNNTADFNILIDHNRHLGASCANLTGPLLDHLDTIHVVKDHELVRQALGDDKFNLIGESYGSQLGSQYAALFPQNVGRMTLDGNLDHSQSEASSLHAESSTYETVLNQFLSWCDRDSTCALHNQNASHALDELLARADAAPLLAPGCGDVGGNACQPNVTGEDLRYNIQGHGFLSIVSATYGSNWYDLAQALAEAADGNATLLSTSIETSNISPSNSYASLAIGCQDWLHESTCAADIQSKTQMASTFAPRTRGASQSFGYQVRCIGWPAPLTNPQAYLNERVGEAPPVLLVNSIYDPETSIVWAEGLREQMPSAVSITRNGAGHTSYLLRGETSKAMDDFLVQGILPSDGSVYQS